MNNAPDGETAKIPTCRWCDMEGGGHRGLCPEHSANVQAMYGSKYTGDQIREMESQITSLRSRLAEVEEYLLLTKGELDAIKNAPPSNEGTNICGHNRYWVGHYGTCMVCRADRSEKNAAELTAANAELRAELSVALDAIKAHPWGLDTETVEQERDALISHIEAILARQVGGEGK